MPLVNGVYVAPTFVNDSTPAIDAAELNALARAAAGAIEYDRAQNLTTAQKQQAATNVGAVSVNAQTLSTTQKNQAIANIGAVSTATQTLTEAQKQQVATNIGVVSTSSQTLTESQKQQVRDNVGCAAPSQTATVTVATTDWTGSEAPYTATIACSIATASNIIFVEPGGDPTPEQYEALASSGIMCVGQGNGTITLKAYGGLPAVDIQIAVVAEG